MCNKKYTYGEIVAVGRKLRSIENVSNNFSQFRYQFETQLNENCSAAFEVISESIVKSLARYRAIYNNMLKSLEK